MRQRIKYFFPLLKKNADLPDSGSIAIRMYLACIPYGVMIRLEKKHCRSQAFFETTDPVLRQRR